MVKPDLQLASSFFPNADVLCRTGFADMISRDRENGFCRERNRTNRKNEAEFKWQTGL